ncbi:peptidyl-prolyl cis-trans isomerase [Sphingorhabdus arenilitoris]|uniref:peptidylprolyl isomerase n=1 Tax=Sphingorhabdus arenilitoris TaxID=1490041 RepID=A0ABV8RJM1_9SPHN
MTMKDRIKGALREPLIHFLIAGLVIFLLFAWRGYGVDPASRTIIIDEAQVSRLGKSFEQTFQREPSPKEVDGLIREYIKEEIYYREALRLGLDSEDPVIRRRLRSKMEFLAQAKLDSVRPTDAALQKMIDANPQKYAADARYSFDQIYLNAFDPEIAGSKAEALLSKLKSGADWQSLGDNLSVPKSMDDIPRSEIERQFGEEFTKGLSSLADAPKNSWVGPIGSGFGIHLLRIRSAAAASKPKLADVRQAVENDWRAETMEKREEEAYNVLLSAYDIEIKK